MGAKLALGPPHGEDGKALVGITTREGSISEVALPIIPPIWRSTVQVKLWAPGQGEPVLLVNIYALVVSLLLGVVYFYYHPNIKISYIGTLSCLFLATFISFMSVFIVLFLLFYEVVVQFDKRNEVSLKDLILDTFRKLEKLFDISIVIASIYFLLWIGLGYNYIENFINASLSENPDGSITTSAPIMFCGSSYCEKFNDEPTVVGGATIYWNCH